MRAPATLGLGRTRQRDLGTSPVIASILFVVVSVVMGAVIWAAVSDLGSAQEDNEYASFVLEAQETEHGQPTRWIRILLVRGEQAPYTPGYVALIVTAPDGSPVQASPAEGILCRQTIALATNRCSAPDNFFDTGTTPNSRWDHGLPLYVPCQDEGPHFLVLRLHANVVIDSTVTCGAEAFI